MNADSGQWDAAIVEAIAAFDAGNHAFGRFVTYEVRRRGSTIPPSVQTVRERLQEAALSVPQTGSIDEAIEFLAILLDANAAMRSFLAAPPAGYALEEALGAPEALDEAVAVLSAALSSRS